MPTESSTPSIPSPEVLLERLREMHGFVRQAVLADRHDAIVGGTVGAGDRAQPVDGDGATDFTFAPDRIAEDRIAEYCRQWAADEGPLRLVTEDADVVFPAGARAAEARFRVLVDPIDGTRVFLRDLRSAWTISAVVPEKPGAGPGHRRPGGEEEASGEPTLADTIAALQTELPVTRQEIAEVLATAEGTPPRIERWRLAPDAGWDPTADRRLDERRLDTGDEDTIEHTFVSFCKFFPEGKTQIARIEEAALASVSLRGGREHGRSYSFDDQYLSTAGQLWCLATGRYAMVADVRPLVNRKLAAAGRPTAIVGHPYDLASLRVATDAGVRVTDLAGEPLAPRAVATDEVGFLAYANDAVRRRLEPAVLDAIRSYANEDPEAPRR